MSLCPQIDIASQGDSVEEARKNLIEAIELFFEMARSQEILARMYSRLSSNQICTEPSKKKSAMRSFFLHSVFLKPVLHFLPTVLSIGLAIGRAVVGMEGMGRFGIDNDLGTLGTAPEPIAHLFHCI